MKQLIFALTGVALALATIATGCETGESACDEAMETTANCGIGPGRCSPDDSMDVCAARCINTATRVAEDGSRCADLTALADAFEKAPQFIADLDEWERQIDVIRAGGAVGDASAEDAGTGTRSFRPLYTRDLFEILTVSNFYDDTVPEIEDAAVPKKPAGIAVPVCVDDKPAGCMSQGFRDCLASCYFNP